MSSPELSDVYDRELVHEEDDGHSSDSSDEADEEERENSTWDSEICNKNIKLDDDSCTKCDDCSAVCHPSVTRICSLPSLTEIKSILPP
ncbi:hypothetical protein OROGR_005825 [Orobanche gracilis]